MLDLSPDKILMLGLIALVVLGPTRLPQAARSLGRLVGQMRAFTASMQTELRDAIHDHDPDETFSAVITELNPRGIRHSVRRAITDTVTPPGQAPDGAGSPSSAPPGAVSPSSAPSASAASPRRELSAPARAPEDPSFN